MGAFESKYWKKPLGRHIVVVDNGRHSTLRRCRTCIHQVRKEHSVVEDGFFDSGADSIVIIQEYAMQGEKLPVFKDKIFCK